MGEQYIFTIENLGKAYAKREVRAGRETKSLRSEYELRLETVLRLTVSPNSANLMQATGKRGSRAESGKGASCPNSTFSPSKI